MRISRRWLGNYIDLPDDNELLIRTLTFSGIEVEAVEELPALPDTVLTARILTAEKIPGTDHLMVCTVEYGGSQPVQVVCGAPNCRPGMLSVLALPGSVLPKVTIKSAKLKGVESHGMLCSERELGISDTHAGIIELDVNTPLGLPVNDLYELPDTLLDLEITPNRSDLLGYLGIARDLSASLGTPVKFPELLPIAGADCPEIDLKLILEDSENCPRYTARLLTDIRVQDSPQWLKTALIKTGLRPINNVVDITNFVMLETGHPLHAFDYDQLAPVEAGDPQPAIVVRKARPGEEFVALDGKSYVLDDQALVIADGQKASALAGVMGGKDSAISDSTRTLVLESASFNPCSIRATSYRYKISTDSSYRFERHLSPALPIDASVRATELLVRVSGGKVCHGLKDAYPEPERPLYLALRPRRFTELIGYQLEENAIKTYLEALGCRFVQYGAWQEEPLTDPALIHCHHAEEQKAGKTEFTEIDCEHALYFQIPPHRVDLTREADLLEELARLAGYDRVPQKTAISLIMDRHAHRVQRAIVDHFALAGFYEMTNYSFCDPAQLADLAFPSEELDRILLRVINPQSSNQSAMRISLLPSLLANLSYNLNHGERNLKLMELARVYHRDGDSYTEPLFLTALCTGQAVPEHWQQKAREIDVYYLKGIIESLLGSLNLPVTATGSMPQPWLVDAENLAFYSGEALCASLSRMRSETVERFGIDIHKLKQDIWVVEIPVQNIVEATRGISTEFQPLPRHPSVVRDISFVIGLNVPYGDIQAAIKAVDPSLIQAVSIFDEYHGKQVPAGLRSLSLHLFLQDSEKTLTDERVDQTVASVLKMLSAAWQIKMR